MSSVIVTGAAKGIGAGIVEAFASAGWSVVAVDRDRPPLDALASRVGSSVVTLAGDVADRATNDAAVQLAVERFGGLDAAVGNAGVNLPKLVDQTTPDEFDRLAILARTLGFKHVASGPFVRSSYHADEMAKVHAS